MHIDFNRLDASDQIRVLRSVVKTSSVDLLNTLTLLSRANPIVRKSKRKPPVITGSLPDALLTKTE
jgi:hypothetical protein